MSSDALVWWGCHITCRGRRIPQAMLPIASGPTEEASQHDTIPDQESRNGNRWTGSLGLIDANYYIWSVIFFFNLLFFLQFLLGDFHYSISRSLMCYSVSFSLLSSPSSVWLRGVRVSLWWNSAYSGPAGDRGPPASNVSPVQVPSMAVPYPSESPLSFIVDHFPSLHCPTLWSSTSGKKGSMQALSVY